MAQVKKCVCMWCHAHCTVGVEVRNDRLVGIVIDESSRRSSFFSSITKPCLRRLAAVEWFYNPDRLNFPMKRAGDRGENRWKQISWDQALDEIGDRLREVINEYGPETIASARGTGRTCDEYRGRFHNLLGSPNIIGAPNICYGPSTATSNAIIGWATWPFPFPNKTGSLLFLGANRYSYPDLWKRFIQVKESGAKLIVVDPRKTEAAEHADVWIQIRPGTDALFLLGMIRIIIDEKLYDKNFVDQYCYGFEDLKEHVQQYQVELVSEVTEVPSHKIFEAARIYATNRPAASFEAMGIEQQPNSIMTLHARNILQALTGNLDVLGGDMIPGPHGKIVTEQEVALDERITPEQRKKQIGSDWVKVLSWPGYEKMAGNLREVWGKAGVGVHDICFAHAPMVYRTMISGKPYPVKVLLTVAANPMVTQANTKLVYNALKEVGLHVVLDFFMTPTAQLADYVLPAASWLERPYLYTGWGMSRLLMGSEMAIPPAIPGRYDRRNDYDFWRELGMRLGQEKYWPWETLEESLDDRLQPIGLTFRELMERGGDESISPEYEKYRQVGFGTSTRKVELKSNLFSSLGYEALPKFREPPESPRSCPELSKKYPYILITGGRFQPMYHSEWRQVRSTRKMHPDPIVQIHPETARAHQIEDGSWTWIESPRGRIRQKCRYFEGIKPNVVHVEHGWWFPEEEACEPSLYGVWKSNANVLTNDDPDACDQMGGIWPLRTGLCRIYKVEE